jgi:threonine dehydrogenase-like Zn-dependent dehydrogenase
MASSGSTDAMMLGAWLPGDGTVDVHEVAVPTRGPGQVLLRMRASTICGSDLRAIYHGHVGPEPYDGVIAGHEPCGEVVEADPGSRLRAGDRVVVYHIVGCLRCRPCRAGSFITCEASYPDKLAYGYQRDGGHAEYLLAEEQSCVPLPDELSFVDGAAVACGFGTAYEGIVRAEIDGRDAVLVTGLGPVGLAAGLLAKAMGAQHVIGYNRSPFRSDLARELGAVDEVVTPGAEPDEVVEQVLGMTDGRGVEVAVDCTGAHASRAAALRSTRAEGRLVLVGEGGRLGLDASEWVIHPQRRIIGSWVTSVPRMEDLLEHLVRWDLHPERTVTGCFPLAKAGDAYALADSSRAGKVAVVMDD